jgi:phosphoribosyl 1,2-cyclic phosphodiesterase
MIVQVVPLGSGSRGNATLVEFGETRLLVDAGLSARMLGRRLGELGVEPNAIDAILLSHEHQDHARGAERFSRQHGVPVVCAVETLEAADLSRSHFAAWHSLEPGRRFEVGSVQIDPFPVPHDAARPVGFVLEGNGARVGIVTDLGQATTLVVQRLRGCHALMIEANHDDAMLRDGPYPWRLKQRVGGRMGHLSNDEAARLVEGAADGNCKVVILAHLSEKNNEPRLASAAAERALRRAGRRGVRVVVAASREASPPVVL